MAGYLIVPQDPIGRDLLLSVDRVTKEDVRVLYRIYEDFDWRLNTITTQYVECLIASVHQTPAKEINFYDFMVVKATMKYNSNAEKQGNINVQFIPGSELKQVIEDAVKAAASIGYQSEQKRTFDMFAFPNNKDRNDLFDSIDRLTRQALQSKYDITITQPWIATAIAHTFLINIIKELVVQCIRGNKKSAMINFNDNIEMHAVVEGDDALNIYMRPGMNAKLLIKDDELTEIDDEMDDE